MKSLALLIPFVLTGCTQPERAAAAPSSLPSVTVPTAAPDAPIQPAHFVAYVEATEEGGYRAIAYFPDEDRTEVLQTWEDVGPAPVLAVVPSPMAWLRSAFGTDAGAPRLHLSSYTGDLLLAPEAATEALVLDIIGDRALCARLETDAGAMQPFYGLTVYHRADATELGSVYGKPIWSSQMMRFHTLSPDRDLILFTGPDGTYDVECDPSHVTADRKNLLMVRHEKRGLVSAVRVSRTTPAVTTSVATARRRNSH